ncbi:ORMDL family protein [Actinidia rufa]|uniref:ORMDL family protein n=1 Tax=Actinidia rufa TaxID=165716 RepID=A0A7J0DX20_9ERIC|nr:ORMDL family protein [Actinidia rufa]
MANLYVRAIPPTDLNRNTEWFTYPGVWSTYILILFFSWLVVLSVFGCSPGMAWTIVHLSHFLVTYQFFHWKKGTPFADDQGIYNRLTWWEQIENGKQLTRNRKFLTVVPVVLYFDSLPHDRLPTPNALLQHTRSFLCWWLPSSRTCTRSVFLESMPISEPRSSSMLL